MTRKGIVGAATGVVLVAAAVIVGWQYLPDQSGPAAATTADTPVAEPAAETVEVARGDLTSEYDFTGEVSFGESWILPLSLEGVVTASHPEGTIVDFGDDLIRVDGEPIFLAEGDVPMYRELALTSPHMSGDDVAQLQRLLLAAGYDDDGALEVDGDFGPTTRNAVKDWQEAVGLTETGRVDHSHLVFSPTPLRIESTARVGTAFEALEVTEPTSTVTVDISASERVELPEDSEVSLELADGTALDGIVVSHDRVVESDGSTSWRATVAVEGEVSGEETSVLVHSTVVEASGVLVVPTSALLAVAEGGFALEVVESTGARLVAVEVGGVVDARAEITGDLEPGELVVVPA